MAVSKIKQSGATPAGDFTALFSWEASVQADLTGLGPEEAECYGFVDVTLVQITGWTTTAVDYIRIYGAPIADGGEEAGIHDGRSKDVSGTGYQLSASGVVILVSEDFVRIENIDLLSSGASGTSHNLQFVSVGAGSDFLVNGCIIHDNRSSASTGANIHSSDADTQITIRNCIIYGRLRGTQLNTAGIVADIENCTLFGNSDFGLVLNATTSVSNTYVGGWTTEDFWTGGTAPSGDYNVSQDTSATVDFANGVGSKAAVDQFVNASLGSSADFTPKTGSDIIAATPRLGSVLTDIIGASRLDPTTIGAWEFTEAPSVTANPVASLLGL